MSVVAFGVLPGERLARQRGADGRRAAPSICHCGAAWFVTLGAVMALTTSLNATMLVPSRLAIMLARGPPGAAPGWARSIPRPARRYAGLTLTLVGAAALLLSGQVSLALNIAVFALVLLYLLHSLALLLLPRLNPPLFASVTVPHPVGRPARRRACSRSWPWAGWSSVQVARRPAQRCARSSFAGARSRGSR